MLALRAPASLRSRRSRDGLILERTLTNHHCVARWLSYASSEKDDYATLGVHARTRATFGTVQGYRPRADAPMFVLFSTLTELVKKHAGVIPFDAPKALLDAEKQGKTGPYRFADIGDVPVDFLANLDITGGNSGSPTLNGKGELVGLAFDTTYEGVASDWLYLPETTRSIHVDARYILWVLDAVGGATELLTELGQKPAFAKP